MKITPQDRDSIAKSDGPHAVVAWGVLDPSRAPGSSGSDDQSRPRRKGWRASAELGHRAHHETEGRTHRHAKRQIVEQLPEHKAQCGADRDTPSDAVMIQFGSQHVIRISAFERNDKARSTLIHRAFGP